MAPDWTWTDPRYAHIPSADPDVEWALTEGAGRAHFFGPGRQERWMPVLVQLRGITAKDFANGQQFFDDARSLAWWQESVRVSPLYTENDQGARDETHCVAMVRQAFFEFLKQNDKLMKVVVRVTLGLPLDAESLGFPASAATGERDRP